MQCEISFDSWPGSDSVCCLDKMHAVNGCSIMAASFDVEVQAEEKDNGDQEGDESEEDQLLQ